MVKANEMASLKRRRVTHMFSIILALAAVPEVGTTLALFGIAFGSLVFIRAKLK
jgi:hypothetical protein